MYRFTPPDAGTFWDHPHLNETEQLEKGLYGALIIRPQTNWRWTTRRFACSTTYASPRAGRSQSSGLMPSQRPRRQRARDLRDVRAAHALRSLYQTCESHGELNTCRKISTPAMTKGRPPHAGLAVDRRQ